MNKKKKMNLTLTLPDDMIVQILLKLPVRSLLRFKCVSKSWLCLISDPQFAKSHFDLAAAPTHRLFVKYDSFRVSIDLEALFHDDSFLVQLASPFPLSLHNSNFRIMGSCRGFILLRFYYQFIIWNPSTGFHKGIPFSRPYSMCEFLCGFGYDAATDDYLVITIMPLPESGLSKVATGMEFFSLKTNSWNRIEGINYPFSVVDDEVSSAFKVGLFLNGALHWFDFCSSLDVIDKIISFDLTERTLSEIPLPYDLAKTLDVGAYNLTVNGGCLSLCNCRATYWSTGECEAMVEIWTMKEYKVQSSWTKSTVLITFLTAPDNDFSPICFTEGGEIVVGSEERRVIMKLDGEGEGKLLEYRKLLKYRKYGPDFIDYMFLSNPCSIMYRESLLSLPSDFGEA
ncbi:F-box/kelch-repeat protein At3g06240-like [Gastrolobium bilobum]|uniref:F-box/kelch-repeat protein At3g06240-like n=1 Tax=Gastrolobium bilobum TaxID=150636 RepID=UPI002AB28DBA|nr:F-box/kelch-repeat protein At3g06240-like [Gastrolobium bilobum]